MRIYSDKLYFKLYGHRVINVEQPTILSINARTVKSVYSTLCHRRPARFLFFCEHRRTIYPYVNSNFSTHAVRAHAVFVL